MLDTWTLWDYGSWLRLPFPKRGQTQTGYLNHPEASYGDPYCSHFSLKAAPKIQAHPTPPKVPLLRAIWSLLDGIWGLLKGSWGVLDVPGVSSQKL